ncbi:MAG TPA: septation protein IspZ [Allosphingosinicella sp.]
MTDQAAAKPSAAFNFMVDFGPLLAFFIAFKVGGVFFGTAVFMVAIAIAVAVSLARFRRVSPMTWISAVLIVGFGALTLYFGNPRFIQMKPTIIYAGFALLLFAGLAAGRPLLKYVFHLAFEGLSDKGWMKLTLNWALFFAAMAILNEILRARLSFETWLTVKVWGITILSLLFAFANIPMLLRHGLTVPEDEKTGADPATPAPAEPPLPPVPPQG